MSCQMLNKLEVPTEAKTVAGGTPQTLLTHAKHDTESRGLHPVCK